jgi:hypothetical protein
MGDRRGVHRVLVGKPWGGNLREKDHKEDPGIDGRIILRCIFRKWDVGIWTRLNWLTIRIGGGLL